MSALSCRVTALTLARMTFFAVSAPRPLIPTGRRTMRPTVRFIRPCVTIRPTTQQRYQGAAALRPSSVVPGGNEVHLPLMSTREDIILDIAALPYTASWRDWTSSSIFQVGIAGQSGLKLFWSAQRGPLWVVALRQSLVMVGWACVALEVSQTSRVGRLVKSTVQLSKCNFPRIKA